MMLTVASMTMAGWDKVKKRSTGETGCVLILLREREGECVNRWYECHVEVEGRPH
jgi:hypothetical protein